MLQFITALEKTAATSHYTGSNRFDSFAPIRLNVSAQWLVDGVSDVPWITSISALGAWECNLNSVFSSSAIIFGTFPAPCFLQKRASTFMIGGFLQVGVPCVSLARLMRLSSHIFWFYMPLYWVTHLFLCFCWNWYSQCHRIAFETSEQGQVPTRSIIGKESQGGRKDLHNSLVSILLFHFLAVAKTSAYSQEVSNRTTPTDSKWAYNTPLSLVSGNFVLLLSGRFSFPITLIHAILSLLTSFLC